MTAAAPRRRRRVRAILGAALIGVILLAGGLPTTQEPAQAIEEAISTTATATSATMNYRGGVTATLTVAPATTKAGIPGVRLLTTTPHSAYGATSGMFAPGLDPATTPTVGLEAFAGMCDGLDFSGYCANRNGSLTVTFSRAVTDPILDISGLGGYAQCAEERNTSETYCNIITGNGFTMKTNADGDRTAAAWIAMQLEIVTPGVTFSPIAGAQNIGTTATTLTAASKTSSSRCNVMLPDAAELDGRTMTSTSLAACGSVALKGTFQTVTLSVGTHIQRAPAADGWANGYNTADLGTSLGDLIRLSIRLHEDMGDAPISYDAAQAAVHVQGPLHLGAGITSDADATAKPTLSPKSSITASLDTDDAIGDGVRAPSAIRSTPYSLVVPLTGTTLPGTVAGWIDFNKNGIFDATERVQAVFIAGATSVTLTWAVPGAAVVGDTYLRLRTSFTASEVVDPRGIAQSGEVEDYILTVAAATPGIEVIKLVNGDDANAAPGIFVDAGSTLSFEFRVRNTGNVPLTAVQLTDNVIAAAGIVPVGVWDGTLDPGEVAVFTATRAAPTTGSTLHTNTATASGQPASGGVRITDTDPANATTREILVSILVEKIGEDTNGDWVRMDGSGFRLLTDVAGAPGVAVTPGLVAGAEVGTFTAADVRPGTYWLEETKAPEGFALLAEPVKVVVSATGVLSIAAGQSSPQVTAAANTISVRDVPAFVLPAAGGTGSQGFTLAGGVLIGLALAGAALLEARRVRRGRLAEERVAVQGG
ncbi:GEVED domain-containing protein [Microbacterium sp. WCS2018Hpa-23]|uniref:GEVED domain-containing protein n=1 Tax=Microbacterium sp. WCS2018Hpa-23 TaxID=3073634 RepID=UPI0028830726|nr:GEVED domain-containing protein [Microbacterium sp. WCS2018Hpa-23]